MAINADSAGRSPAGHRTFKILLGVVVVLFAAGIFAIVGDGDDGHPMDGMDRSTMTADRVASTSTPPARAVDAAFTRLMIPHHLMAVQMATIARREAEHPQIKALSAAIITAQNAEIERLRAAAHRDGFESKRGSAMMGGDTTALGLTRREMGMASTMHGLARADPFDRAFIDAMLPHHEGAIAMARVELARGKDPELGTIARGIISAQKSEIAQMRQWRKAWYGDAAPASDDDRPDMDDMPGM